MRESILVAYDEAAATVEQKARLPWQPFLTLREFQRQAAPHLNGAGEPFAQLTGLAELALYSQRALEAKDAEVAQLMAIRVREGLSGGV